MTARVTIVWFRHDLRLEDNPALIAAVERGGPVLPLYIWAPQEEGAWSPGSASRWWLHQSLGQLDDALRAVGSRLILRRGESLVVLQEIARATGAQAVLWNRRYEPAATARDAAIKAALRASGFAAQSFNAGLLFEPWQVQSASGGAVKVFTPFWKRCLSLPQPARPQSAPEQLAAPARWPASEPLTALGLAPTIDWAAGLRAAWQPGEVGAEVQLERFVADGIGGYASERDRPDHDGVSQLSPHLHFGEISPRRIWHEVERAADLPGASTSAQGAEAYLRQLVWREFAHHLLFHFPHTAEQPLRPEFAAFPWREDVSALKAWQRGRTGYPLVDAGMRQLWRTGWMHNRVRLVAASFLVKHLLIPWQVGAAWFWDTLVDADLANNTLGWQWTAGSGADAAPFFRVFNPVLQGEKLDPDGDYVRRWIPELAALPARWIHRPWEAPPATLEAAGVALGTTYPEPIIDHAFARQRALAAFARMRLARGK